MGGLHHHHDHGNERSKPPEENNNFRHKNAAGEEINSRNMLYAIFLNFIITVVEVIGGLLSNSLALLSDALHNFSDTVSILIAYVAHKVGKRKTTPRQTFGYKRIEILAALFNAVTLAAICLYLFYEAYHRFMEPEPIKGALMLIVATIGLIANLIAVLLLHKDKAKNINIKAAYLHLLGDTLSSVAVMIGGALIYFYEVYWLDPVLTFLIALYILKETYAVLKETLEILMQAAPDDIEQSAIEVELCKFPEIENIHHIHIWRLDDQSIHFECHMEVKENITISEAGVIRQKAEEILRDKFHVSHTTIQIEYRSCHK